MLAKNHLAPALLALALIAAPAGAALAAGPHAHDGHAAIGQELTLDNGRKWQTDAPLRTGMDGIRTLLAGSLPQIHDGTLPPEKFGSLAAGIEERIDSVVANCRLPEDADAQLHLVLAEIIEGAGQMKGDGDRRQGAVRIVQALDAYGAHFDHPGWKGLVH